MSSVVAMPGGYEETKEPRRPGGVARSPAEFDGNAEQLDRALRPRLRELHHHLAGGNQLRGQRLLEAEHRLQAAVVIGGEGAPLVARARQKDRRDLGVGLRVRPVKRVVGEIRATHAVAERLPELRLQRAERHVPVGALIRAVAVVAPGEAEVPALRGTAGGEHLGRHHGQPRQRAVEHRAVHELALPGALALAQGDEDPHRRHQRATAEVGDLARRLDRRPAGRAGQPQQPVEAEVVHVVARAGAVGSVLAVAGDGAVHETGVLGAQALVAHPEPVEHSRPEGLQHYVGIADEAQQSVAAAV
jgi:hypothetical protein